MTMPIKHAKGLIGELVGNFDSDGRHMEAWDTVLAHIEVRVVTDEMEKVITDEMVDRAIKARYEFAYRKFFGSDSPSTIPDHREEMRAALQAALGVGK